MDAEGREIVDLLAAVERAAKNLASTVGEGEIGVVVPGRSKCAVDADVVQYVKGVRG